MRARLGFLLVVVAVTAFAGSVQAQTAPPQRPQFSAAVEVTSVDVAVVDRRSQPVTDLAPADFAVRIDGAERKVVTAQWISLTKPESGNTVMPPPGYSSNTATGSGRLILIAIDQPNIRFGATATIQRAVEAFIDRLQPADRVAAVAIGPGAQSTAFTADREQVKRAISRMSGNRTSIDGRAYNVSLSEALDIYHGSTAVWQSTTARECAGLQPMERTTCVSAVQSTASVIALQALGDGSQTLAGLEGLFDGLRAIPGPKSMLLISEGFVSDDPVAAIQDLGTKAALSQTTVFALKLDDQAFDTSRGDVSPQRLADRLVLAERLELVTGAARGSVFDVVSSVEPLLEQIEAELSGYYLLGVESASTDRDGSPHRVNVSVNRDGLTVRSRRAFVMNAAQTVRSPRARAAEALGSPILLSSLPLRVATFSLAGTPESQVQVLVHAEVGEGFSSSRQVAVAYTVTDRTGKIVDQQAVSPRLSPVMNGVPSPLQFNASANVPTGEYVLKIAVVDGEQVGSVEHPVRAELGTADVYRVSDLIAGGPAEARFKIQPTVGYEITFGILHGFFEAYGRGVGTLVARYEIASDPEGPALVSARVQSELANEQRAVFTHMMPVRQLPPGRYVLRARLLTVRADAQNNPDAAIATLIREFVVATPPVLLTSAETGGRASATSDLFLPVDERLFQRRFVLDDVTRADTVRVFRERSSPAARAGFDRGVSALSSRKYEDAQANFKNGIGVDGENTGPLTYLAATYAAAGLDPQAAAAWQTALIDGSDLPQIFVWLSDALLRSRDFIGARAILEEATKKWPSDARFAKPLALVYATFGQGREAVRTLERHLDASPDDAEALALGVEWIYHLQVAGAVARTRAEDIRLARRYADAYQRTKGPQAALVREWVAAIERPRP